MERKYNNKTVGLIKELMYKNYKTSSIVEIMFNEHNIEVSVNSIISIRNGESYADVKPHLNQSIEANCCAPLNEEERNNIRKVKLALLDDCPEEEIRKSFNITKKEMVKIKMGYSKYYNVALELNSAMEKWFKRKKQINVNDAIVKVIKQEYVINNGIVLLNEMAEKYKIGESTISNILNLKSYVSAGESYNEGIKSIKKGIEAKKLSKEKEKKVKRINTERLRISELKHKNCAISRKIKECEAKIVKLRITI